MDLSSYSCKNIKKYIIWGENRNEMIKINIQNENTFKNYLPILKNNENNLDNYKKYLSNFKNDETKSNYFKY
jgi:hypothetical protein